MMSAASLLEHRLEDMEPTSRRPAELLIIDVRRLQSLVVELLELARLDAGGESMHFEVLDLRTAVMTVLQSQPTDKTLMVDVPEGVRVSADRAHLRRVLGNLVENALVHGGPHVRITAWKRERFADLEVIDDGPGVSHDDADRIFARFYKADAGRSQEGSGLGLAIALEHARALGGSLELANPGEPGARFVLSLPLAARVDADDEQPADESPRPQLTMPGS
jgi:two-component system sensor histidine kinase MtrB